MFQFHKRIHRARKAELEAQSGDFVDFVGFFTPILVSLTKIQTIAPQVRKFPMPNTPHFYSH